MGIAEPLKLGDWRGFLEKQGRDATLLYVKCKYGNNKVGNELISETSFLWVSFKFLAKIHG